MALAEGGESEIATNDPEVNLAAPASDYSQISSTFQSELYEALMRRSNADVTDFQNLLLQLLNLLNGHQPVPRDLKIQYTLLPLLIDFNRWPTDSLKQVRLLQIDTANTVIYSEKWHTCKTSFLQYREFEMKSPNKAKEETFAKQSFHAAEYWPLRVTIMPVA